MPSLVPQTPQVKPDRRTHHFYMFWIKDSVMDTNVQSNASELRSGVEGKETCVGREASSGPTPDSARRTLRQRTSVVN